MSTKKTTRKRKPKKIQEQLPKQTKNNTKTNYRKKQRDQLETLEKQIEKLEQANREFLVKEAILKTKAKIYKKQLKYFQDFMQNALSLATRSSSKSTVLPHVPNTFNLSNGLNFDLLEDQKFD
ncbi:hypothetical protein M0813_23448 [Anaeramoeba flamelloides]|uniref:BZIP domain-containing protein n=1 Tax=Anaeramoeba flamelloides TaxID=1746091 RepID=A0AAV8A3B8_9EUKA|nr:hypothetical protein M0812_07469 [Anaeramoeba flamelloides]KAJ3452677.1 hypothetical protein M0812_04451 [Anaeramoeba flamelloides]KAJ6237598.1 hypothetical protein M0813_27161 [Anaeramoeba flamelloides]KAJ6241256.1 hypothetical protein M0813_23448 [Anaeramoeba flamelloides]|eukprot:Anaeramoba_flamelloidesa118538_15.p1 GENE.a118538_15~~a118538_15.p1  ORF type:complete len:123 (+),score=38.59 a118538_15:97-465(+)